MDAPEFLRERGLEFLFFGLLTVYVVAMLLELPPGRSGMVPALVIGVALVLLVYRLLAIMVPGVEEFVADIGSVIELTYTRPDEIVETDGTPEDRDEDAGSIGGPLEEELSAPRDLVATMAWILIGVGVIFALGLVIGGFLYIASFLYVSGGYRLWRSLGVATVFVAAMYVLIEAFNFLVWGGVIDILGAL